MADELVQILLDIYCPFNIPEKIQCYALKLVKAQSTAVDQIGSV